VTVDRTPGDPDPPRWEHAEVIIASTANERTSMAWSRTALAWAAVGAAVVRYQAETGVASVRMVAGGALIVCGGAMWLVSQGRYRQRDQALREDRPLPDPGPMIGSVAVLVIGAIVLVLAAEVIDLAADL
jgi:putative membrane protein